MGRVLMLMLVWVSLCQITGQIKADVDDLNYSVQPITEYDALFTKEKGWTGADGAYSVSLSDTTTLWLYSDTWIGDIINGRHKDATMINNTIALQSGKNPLSASANFFWQTTKDGKPASFIKPADGIGWFWLYHGVIADGKLYLFLMRTIKTDEKSVWGFKQTGTVLAQIDNPHDDPMNWRMKQYNVPFGRYSDNGNMFFGSAVMQDKDMVYIYGCKEDWKKGIDGRSMIVARVRPSEIEDFGKWRFFNNGQWKKDVNDATELFGGIASEYSVSFQPILKKYVVIYTENGMSPNIFMRVSDTPVGPWSKPHKVYECPDCNWHKTYFCYAAKAHPALSGPDDLLITYVCNSTDFWQMASDARIYRPRFLRIKFNVQERQ